MPTRLDAAMMARALALARRGIYRSRPNPSVGCVLVRGDAVLGEGYTQAFGGRHAEVEALSRAGDPRGATAYVTLEPCAHRGKTGPCADALIAAGIAACFVAVRDPNPEVAGRGIDKLARAGVAVSEGLLEREAEQVNAGFFQRMRTGKPRIRLKLAASVDGRTGMASGESRWITGPAARADAQKWRARSDAIVTGVGTVLLDDPALTVRDGALDIARQPLRVICDSRLRTPGQARILAQPGATLVVHSQPRAAANAARGPSGGAAVEWLRLPGPGGRVDLAALVAQLAARQCNDILVECGASLAGAFVASGLADELIVYRAPVLLGSQARPLLELAMGRMAERRRLKLVESRRMGEDTRAIYHFAE